jgi:effector-binding domain-containing protein
VPSNCAGCSGCAGPSCKLRSLPTHPGWRRSRRGFRSSRWRAQCQLTTIQVKRIPAVRVAELSATAARLEPAFITPVIRPLYRELGGGLGRAGLMPVGPAIAYYQDVPGGEGVVVHATLPVNAEPGRGHGFEITELPKIALAATVVHRGSMANVMGSIQALARWIDDNGYRSTGYPRELYLECPDDEDKWVTELQEPIIPLTGVPD